MLHNFLRYVITCFNGFLNVLGNGWLRGFRVSLVQVFRFVDLVEKKSAYVKKCPC